MDQIEQMSRVLRKILSDLSGMPAGNDAAISSRIEQELNDELDLDPKEIFETGRSLRLPDSEILQNDNLKEQLFEVLERYLDFNEIPSNEKAKHYEAVLKSIEGIEKKSDTYSIERQARLGRIRSKIDDLRG